MRPGFESRQRNYSRRAFVVANPPAAHPPGHALSRFNFLIARIPCGGRAKAMPGNQACAGRPKKQRLTLVSSFDEFARVLGLLGRSRTPREIRFARFICERCQKQLAEHGNKNPSATLGGANRSTREPHGATQNKKDANNSDLNFTQVKKKVEKTY